MFTLADTPVKYVGLIIMFVWCTVWCLYELTRPQSARQRVSGVLHLAMAVVMLIMVPRGPWHALIAVTGIPALAWAFGLMTLWFAWLAIDDVRSRRSWLHSAGHTTMFAAMTWHLAAMAAKRAAMTAGVAPDKATMMLFAIIGVPFMAYLLAAGINDLRRVTLPRAAAIHDCACGTDCACGPNCTCPQPSPVETSTRELALAAVGDGAPAPAVQPIVAATSCHAERPVGTTAYRLSALSDAAMNLGMFWMSTGIMVPLLPFFALFAF